MKLSRANLEKTRIRPDDDLGFMLEIKKGRKRTWYRGEEARRFAATILPAINAMGGVKKTVRQAVHQIETQGNPERFLADVVEGNRFQGKQGLPGYVHKMPKATRLALEMALLPKGAEAFVREQKTGRRKS